MTESVSASDIAIVGMGLRVPGAASPREFWTNLRDGVESIRGYSEAELLAAGERSELLTHPNYVKVGSPLERMEFFDGEFFGFGPRESAILDPQHRHFLECSWEALEDAGHPPDRFPGAIGVFAGCGMGSYFYFNLCTNPELVDSMGMFLLRHTGNDKDFLATRLSYVLNLRGPSINVQTACSTSLVAVHLASQSLLGGECDMALAGGVTIELPHRRGYLYQEREILSPDGKCRAFDHRAQGTVFGSGVAVVVLRRLKDALASGDHVYAIIKGSAVNNDGATKAGYLAPSVDGQAAAVVEALAVANVGADTIDYVECHGTGTYLGDPIEIAALTKAFRETTARQGYCRIGSVKTNIGHLDTAAGTASLIKACLALEHRQFPPSLNFEAPNPAIDFASSPFLVSDKLADWPAEGRPRRATVNSLGVGGTNAHVVLEEAPRRTSSISSRKYQPLVVSARNRVALDAQCDRLADCLAAHPEVNLADVSHTLMTGRRAFEQRRVLACETHAEAVEMLRSKDSRRVHLHTSVGERANVAFMLPGGGAQYVNMARGLYESEAVFRQFVDRGLGYLRSNVDYDPKALLFADGDDIEKARALLLKPSAQLPLLFIIEYALAKLWMAYGVKPSAMIGHSLGENTAAALADVMTFEDGIGLVLLRGRLFDGVPAGGMLSVSLAAKKLEAELGDGLDIACINAPELCVVSGAAQALDALEQKLRQRGVESQRIPIDIAAHSRMLEPILEPFGEHLRKLDLRPPKIPFLSNRSGTFITEREATSPDYWVDHLRHTVRFADGIAKLAEDPARIFLEVGPGRTLGSLAKAGGTVKQQNVLPTLRHQDEVVDDWAFFTSVHARLWALGLPVDVGILRTGETRVIEALPTYAFQGQRHFVEPGKQTGVDTAELALVKEPNVGRWFFRAVWRQRDATPPGPSERQVWLIFLDDAGIGEELMARLRAFGHEVISVREGDAFYRLSDHEYRLSPGQGLEGYEALVRELLASGKAPNRILHAWLLTDGENFRPGSSFFHQNQERGFYGLLFLAQALGARDYPKPLQLVVVTNGMQRVRDETVEYPEKATVLGPARVIPREFPGVTSRIVDVALPSPSRKLMGIAVPPELRHLFASVAQANGTPEAQRARRQVADMLEAELLAPVGDEVVAIRGDQRWVQDFQQTPLPAGVEPAFKRRGVYLITGAFGGIGATIAKDLAERHGARLVLVGRTPLPPAAEFSRWLDRHPNDPLSERIRHVQELEALGAEVLVCGADVTDIERMREAVAESIDRFGRIDGVLHAAGTLDDQPILGKRQTDVEAVLAPKLYGTLVLAEVLKDRPLDFIVLFSSTSAATAPAGQVDYVAANAFLDAFSGSDAARRQRIVALGWGVWKDVGMAGRAATGLGLEPGAQAAATPLDHPLLESRVDQAEQLVFNGRWSPKTHWVLDEHRTAAGQALLPGTGYLELLRAAVAATDRVTALEVRDLYFLRPLYVPDGQIRSIRVELKPDERGYEAAVTSAHDLGEGETGWERHAQSHVSLAEVPSTAALDLEAIGKRCRRSSIEDARGIRTGQEEHLAFGPRWRVLRSVRFGEGEALAKLELGDDFVHDLPTYPLHPALLDLATGFAMDLISGYTSESLWVPISYRSVRVYGPLSKRIYSWVRPTRATRPGVAFASFDVTITDESGRVLVAVSEFTIKRLVDPTFDMTKPPEKSTLEIEVHAGRRRELSRAELAFERTVSQGIGPEEGCDVLHRVLASPVRGPIVASSLDLVRLRRQADATKPAQSEGQMFSRPQLDAELVAPRDDIERTLVEIWQEALGVQGIGVRDSFFDLGGHSLIAVRLFAKIKRTYDVDYPISVLFEAPTIEQCASKLREALGDSTTKTDDEPPSERRTRYTHLVRMHERESKGSSPFFLVAGMFGNVLNLRHLAQLIGAHRPFYGLQARGLYGDQKPHETFEEMARDYIAEVMTVQPRGPYVLGGFSGGGIAAYEMARQLIERGERVALLVMLDTPLPQRDRITKIDRLALRYQELQHQGSAFAVNWVLGKLDYRQRVKRRGEKIRAQEAGASHDFHSELIEAAFYRALGRYELRPISAPIALFRPKLRPRYRLSGNRQLNARFEPLHHDNGWGRIIDNVSVYEVSGDHDSMVLEPNVRVLASRLRECLAGADVVDPAGESSTTVAETLTAAVV